MKIKTNLVSLLAGVALGAVAVLSIAATSMETFSTGRFQLVVTDNYVFKIDTATGQVWHTLTSSPSREFMRPNIGGPAIATNSTPNLEKSPGK